MLEREIPPQDRASAIQSLAKQLARYLPGVRLEVIVRRKKRERSDLQNRALWGCAYKALQEQTGNEAEDLHTYFCGQYFGWVTFQVMGETRKRPLRTTTRDQHGDRDVVDKGVMADFYDSIQRWSAEAGYDVPDPDEEWFRRDEAAA